MELNVVRIYRFVDPSFLVKEPILLHIYLGIPAIHDPEAQKTVIDPYSGHFAIADNSFDTDPELDHSVHVPQTEAQARKAVETVITSAEKRRKEHYALVQRKFPNLFANILFAGAQPVLDQERRLIRQWEVRYQPHVNPSREEARVPVMNGSVVFRIGPGDRLVGLAYNWMPIETSEGVPRLRPTLPAATRSSIVYMIEPGQNLCAPYLVGVPEKPVMAPQQVEPTALEA